MTFLCHLFSRKKPKPPVLWRIPGTPEAPGGVIAEQIENPPGHLRAWYNEAKAERAPNDPDLYGGIEWFIVPLRYCNEVGRFPVPWRGTTTDSKPGTLYVTGYSNRVRRRVALSAIGLIERRTIHIETWNLHGVFPEDDEPQP